MSTEENLKAAFAGESQANRKYLAFAKKAEEEGLKQVAKLFRAAADAETVHALSHLRVLKGVKTTEENLQEAIAGETHEFTEMYPKMIEEAEKEGNEQAKISFNKANTVEKTHAELYTKALESYSKSLELKRKTSNKKEISYSLHIIGNTYLKLKDLSLLVEEFFYFSVI